MRPPVAFIVFALFISSLLLTFNAATLAQIKSPEEKKEFPELFSYPIKNENALLVPPTTASSVVIIDAKTGVILLEKNPRENHFPASTTKLMTALVSLERCSTQTHIKVGPIVKEGTQMGLEQGDVVTVETLLLGMLINSGNDAAYTLAFACSPSYLAFVDSMNTKAKELGMNSTNFENPAGFDGKNHYSTALDLAKLAKVAVANPLISKIVSTKHTVVSDVSGNKTFYLENVNELLGEVEGLQGIKTGQTEGSKEILLSKTTRDNNTIIIAVLGSEDRFEETKSLIEWSFNNHKWINP